MVSSTITSTEGISGNLGAITHGQNTNGTITLAQFLDAFDKKNIPKESIHENALSIDVGLNSGHGYTRSDLVGHYMLGGTIDKVRITYQDETHKKKVNKKKSTAEPETFTVDIDCKDLDQAQRQTIVYYDDSGKYQGSVSCSKALKNYCQKRAEEAIIDRLYTAQGGHARETTGKHVDKRA